MCVNKDYLDKLETFLDDRLKAPSITNEKWREELVTNCKVDAVDSVHKWYFATIIDCDETSDRIRINYDGWSSRYDEWLGRYDPRIQRHKSRAIGGRESGGVIGAIDKATTHRQINQLSPVRSEFKVFILDENMKNCGYVTCAAIGSQYKNQLPGSYDFYSTGDNVIIQWISNQTCGVKIHLAVYPISNINTYLFAHNTMTTNVCKQILLKNETDSNEILQSICIFIDCLQFGGDRAAKQYLQWFYDEIIEKYMCDSNNSNHSDSDIRQTCIYGIGEEKRFYIGILAKAWMRWSLLMLSRI